jgi:methionyl-tRNA formyltransferase
VNLHASHLPKYRGAAPINWAIIRGESVTGNSMIRLAERMDAGAILAQSEVSIGELETAGELHDRLAEDGGPLILKVVDELASGRAVETPQDESLATQAPKLTRGDATLDFTRPARELADRIRGLYPWPGCAVDILDSSGKSRGSVTLVRARSTDAGSGEPGMTHDRGVFAGEGSSIEIVEVKPEGGKPMPLSAYQNGHPWAGLRLRAKQSQR